MASQFAQAVQAQHDRVAAVLESDGGLGAAPAGRAAFVGFDLPHREVMDASADKALCCLRAADATDCVVGALAGLWIDGLLVGLHLAQIREREAVTA